MILEKQAVTLADVAEIIKDDEEKQSLKEYVKKFNHLTKDKAKKLIEELRALNNPKLREEHFVKIADFLPRDADELNRIFADTSFSEEESNAILDVVKKY